MFNNLDKRFQPVTVKFDESLKMPAHSYKIGQLKKYIQEKHPDHNYIKEKADGVKSFQVTPPEIRCKKQGDCFKEMFDISTKMPDFESEHPDVNNLSTLQRNSQEQYFHMMKEEFFPNIKEKLYKILD